jgi:hypothetical protein
MKKKNRFTSTLQSDPISGEIFIAIPEKILNDLEWYEDTEIEIEIEAGDLIIKESKNG